VLRIDLSNIAVVLFLLWYNVQTNSTHRVSVYFRVYSNQVVSCKVLQHAIYTVDRYLRSTAETNIVFLLLRRYQQLIQRTQSDENGGTWKVKQIWVCWDRKPG